MECEPVRCAPAPSGRFKSNSLIFLLIAGLIATRAAKKNKPASSGTGSQCGCCALNYRSRRSIPDTQSTHSELPSHPFPSPVDATLAYASRNKAGAPSLQRGLVHRNRRRTTFEHRSIEVRRRRLAVQGHYSREHKQQDGPHQSPRDAAGVAPGARRAASLGAGHALRGVGAVGVAPDPRGRAVLGRRPDPGAHLEGREPRRPMPKGIVSGHLAQNSL